jgi:hypothetical protein
MAETSNDTEYLERVRLLKDNYPALNNLLNKLPKSTDPGRKSVEETYEKVYNNHPGRCAVLEFYEKTVCPKPFHSAVLLDEYIRDLKTTRPTSEPRCRNRLYLLEDMDRDYVEVLGRHLGVDPLVFSEQMNTWNFMDLKSVGHRALPSLTHPEKSFTLRYYEFRKLLPDPEEEKKRFGPTQRLPPSYPEEVSPSRIKRQPGDNIPLYGHQTSFAVNRRYYERWRTVDGRSMPVDQPIAFLRRCASFWTSQSKTYSHSDGYWDGKTD